MEKHCSGCNITKSHNEFYKAKARKDGLQTYCKPCMKSKNIENYKTHKDVWDARTKAYNKTSSSKKYRREWAKKKYHSNPEFRKKVITQVVQYERQRLDNDPTFKLEKALRSRLKSAVKRANTTKSKKTFKLIGCKTLFLKKYIENMFQEGMTWENYGSSEIKCWHIDHIKPCASFNLSDPKQQIMCFHYTNLQPLWREENLSKSNKFDENTFGKNMGRHTWMDYKS